MAPSSTLAVAIVIRLLRLIYFGHGTITITIAEVDEPKYYVYPRLLRLVYFGAKFKNKEPKKRYDSTLPL